jgi:hypothetical protein
MDGIEGCLSLKKCGGKVGMTAAPDSIGWHLDASTLSSRRPSQRRRGGCCSGQMVSLLSVMRSGTASG